MPTDTRTQLRNLGDDLRRDSTPITLDEIVRSDDPTRSAGVTLARSASKTGRRGTIARASTLVATAAAVIGLVMIADRPDADPVADRPGSSVLPEPVAPSGALVLDDSVQGWQLRAASADQQATDAPLFVRRIYATDDPRPENGSFDVDGGSPGLSAPTATISVGGADGFLFDRASGGRGLVFERDGYWYDITSYGLTDAQLIAAGEAARRADDGNGAVIDPVGLPAALVAEAVGVEGELLGVSALDNQMSFALWNSGTRSVWLQSFVQEPSVNRFQRIGAASVVDTTVNGQPAFVRTFEGQDEFRSITWHTDGYTHSLESLGVGEQDLIEFAEALRPATKREWDAVLVSVAPPIACLGAECTDLPEPGSLIPAGGDLFPAIDESLVPDDGGGATYAYYTYFGGIDGRQSTWIGVLGVPDTQVLDGLITVMVSAANDADLPPLEPGRSPDVAEYDYDTGVKLVKTLPDSTVVIVQGRDIDQLYRVLDNIEPTINNDGELSGYQLTGELPDGLEELEAPFQRGLDNGSFPKVHVHNGELEITILPGPPLHIVSEFIGPIEQLTLNGGPALFYALPESDYGFLATTLADGSTMTIAGGFSRQELIDLASSVELLDEQSWKDRYDPMLPILQTLSVSVDAPVSTVAIDQGN
jgi:hypothetical protein